ncbi:MAG: hypothetical protein C0501_05815 [Isosphaera sp.]|nr:hypothetical protein [Isosphaera sp.]
MAEPYRTMAEIEATYPNEWVLIDEPTVDRRTDRVSGGRVVMHTPDRAEFDHRLVDRDEFPHVVRCAILYTGKPTEEPGVDLFWFKHAP